MPLCNPWGWEPRELPDPKQGEGLTSAGIVVRGDFRVGILVWGYKGGEGKGGGWGAGRRAAHNSWDRCPNWVPEWGPLPSGIGTTPRRKDQTFGFDEGLRGA